MQPTVNIVVEKEPVKTMPSPKPPTPPKPPPTPPEPQFVEAADAPPDLPEVESIKASLFEPKIKLEYVPPPPPEPSDDILVFALGALAGAALVWAFYSPAPVQFKISPPPSPVS